MCEIRKNIFTLPASQIFAQNLASLSYVAHISLDSRSPSLTAAKSTSKFRIFSREELLSTSTLKFSTQTAANIQTLSFTKRIPSFSHSGKHFRPLQEPF
jgi:hypothetical protein